MLNKVPNNNDATHVANIVLNKAPNSNDAMHIVNNVCLTTMGAQKFLMAAIWPSCRKVDLPETRDNDMKAIEVHAGRNKFCPGKLYAQ